MRALCLCIGHSERNESISIRMNSRYYYYADIPSRVVFSAILALEASVTSQNVCSRAVSCQKTLVSDEDLTSDVDCDP